MNWRGNLKDKIICLINAVMLFGVWLFASVFVSTGDEWWSLYTINMEKISPWNVEISWIKVCIFAFISLVIAFFPYNILKKSSKDQF